MYVYNDFVVIFCLTTGIKYPYFVSVGSLWMTKEFKNNVQ